MMIRALLTTLLSITTASAISGAFTDVSASTAIAAQFVKDVQDVVAGNDGRRMQSAEDLAAICDTLGTSRCFCRRAVMLGSKAMWCEEGRKEIENEGCQSWRVQSSKIPAIN